MPLQVSWKPTFYHRLPYFSTRVLIRRAVFNVPCNINGYARSCEKYAARITWPWSPSVKRLYCDNKVWRYFRIHHFRQDPYTDGAGWDNSWCDWKVLQTNHEGWLPWLQGTVALIQRASTLPQFIVVKPKPKQWQRPTTWRKTYN